MLRGGNDSRFSDTPGSGQSLSERNRNRSTLPELEEDPKTPTLQSQAALSSDYHTIKGSSSRSFSFASQPTVTSIAEAAPAVAGESKVVGAVGLNAPVVTVGNNHQYLKYFKMVKLGLSPQSVAAKMLSDGLVKSLEDGLKVTRPVPFISIYYHIQ
jgi:hypothetical protein